MKKFIFIVILILWVIIIYLFSNQPIKNSLNTSDIFVDKIVKIINKDNRYDNKIIIKRVTYIVRKTAHFTEYMILGILIYLVLSSFELNKVFIISLILCFIYACSDEIHQLFVSGRTSKVLDVIIDTSGSMLGIIIINKLKSKFVFEKK